MAEKISRSSRSSKRSGSSRGAGGTAAPPPGSDAEVGAEPIVIAERITVIAEAPVDGTAAGIAPQSGTEAAGTERAGEASRITDEQRYLMIAERAYERARERGFAPGRELEDWLLAEQEIEAQLAGM